MDFSSTFDNLLVSQSASLPSATPYFNAGALQDFISGATLLGNANSILVVNSIVDVVDDTDGVTTLREAIHSANAVIGEDSIVFDESLFASEQTITLSLGQLYITDSLSIAAPLDSITGANLVTVSGNNASRVFEIGTQATVSIFGLIIADGSVTDDNGGGIKNSGTLTLDSSIVRDNTVNIDSADVSGGGGIYNTGTLEVNNSTISGNRVVGSGSRNSSSNGGGIYNGGTLTVSDSTLGNNSVGGTGTGLGGGIYNTGIVTVNNTTLSDNRTTSAPTGNSGGGGGIYNTGIVTVNNTTLSDNRATSALTGNRGGGIYNTGIVEVNNSTLMDNTASSYMARSSGGGIFNDAGGTVTVNNSILIGNTLRVESSLGEGGGIFNLGTLTVSNSTLTDNSVSGRGTLGGGIYNGGTLTVSNSTLGNNLTSIGSVFSRYGGGIYNSAGGTVEVHNSILSNNSTGDFGGGIYNLGILRVSNSTLSGNSASNDLTVGFIGAGGGGIYNGAGGLVTVSNSTLSDNRALGVFVASGGGIFNNGIVTLTNSTLSGNSALRNGGGIFNNGTLTLLFTTLTLNSAANGGGVFINTNGSASVGNTIIAQNLLTEGGVNPDVVGSFTSDGYNLIGDNTGSSGFSATGDIVGTSSDPINPRLGSLAANGGSTATHALLESSPAINAGDPQVVSNPFTDQRDFRRVINGRADIGAFEFS